MSYFSASLPHSDYPAPSSDGHEDSRKPMMRAQQGDGLLPPAEQPSDGDVIVIPDAGRRGWYLVLCADGGAQVRCSAREEALTVARSFAEHANVDAWIRDGFLACLARHRPNSNGRKTASAG